MRILLVGNYALDHQTSMLRYADMLRRQMTARGHDVEVIQPGVIVGGLVSQPMVRKWLGYVDKYLLFPFRLRARMRGFEMVHICDHSNSMYLAHTGGRPSSITCHDLLAIRSAQGRYPQQQRASFSGKVQQRWILKHLAAARNVVCVSSNTARELAAISEGQARRAVVIPNALESHCLPASEESVQALRTRLGIVSGERYLFHIGGNLWYKNRLGVLRLFQLLRSRGLPGLRLVMAGAPFTREMRDFVSANLPAGSVIEVVDPTDAELWSLYSGATALLYPSLHEGFGWPLIEAQCCGCPVITSKRAPMTEVAGVAALYIDPEDELGAARIIAERLDSLAELRAAGFENAKRFDPAVIIPAYEGFFAGVLRSRRRTDGNVATDEARETHQGS
jgi:glycosyltransferase involved in cell wall biosynthesis